MTEVNPAKAFLRRYRFILARQDSLIRQLAALRDRQTNCTVKLTGMPISGGGFVNDRMAEEVVRVIEIEEQLTEQERKAAKELEEILQAINSIKEEPLKTVLILRYCEGLYWEKIAERMGYEIRNVYILHGRALWKVNQWLNERGNIFVE